MNAYWTASGSGRFWMKAVTLILVVAVAWVARWKAVQELPVDYDEDDYLRAAQQYAEAIQQGRPAALLDLNYRTEHPPLSKLAAGMALLPLPPFPAIPDLPTSAPPSKTLPSAPLQAARISVALLNMAEVILLALLNPLAGLFLSVHTFTIKYASQVMLESLPAFTSALIVVCYERSRVAEHGKWNGWLIASAVALGLTASSKYLYCVAGLAVLVHWGVTVVREARTHKVQAVRKWLSYAAGWGGLALLVFLATDFYLWPDPIARLQDSVFYHAGYAQSKEVQSANLPPWQPLIWLLGSVSWHPEVFYVTLDAVITFFAVLGIRRLFTRRGIYGYWLAAALLFLLIWPTKWPQYILTLTFPLSLAAAEGVSEIVIDPLRRWFQQWQSRDINQYRLEWKMASRQLGKALGWLLPGIIVIGLITFFPLIYQIAISLTNLTTTSLRDGISGGVWREVMAGLSGAKDPVKVNLFNPPRSREVQFTGLSLLGQIFANAAPLLGFEILWTSAVILLQLMLGISVALALNQRGVRFKTLWRILFILPWAIPEFIGALSWSHILDTHVGWLALAMKKFPDNAFLSSVAQWDKNPAMTFMVLTIAGVWMGWPLMMLAAEAGLKMLPAEVYEASSIDGAGEWHRFRHITWPMLLPLLTPVIILRIIATFNQFYLFLLLNSSYPFLSFSTMTYILIAPGYVGTWLAGSAGISVFTVIILLILLWWFDRVSRAGEGVTYA